MLKNIQIFTTAETAKVLNCSPELVRYLERKGALPALRTVSGTRIFLLEDVQRVLRERQAKVAKKNGNGN